MRSSLTCPKCGGRRLWHIHIMRERGAHGLAVDMAVAIAPRAPLAPDPLRDHRGPTPPLEWTPAREYGRFETFACAGCGYTAWYARDFAPDDWLNLPLVERSPCVECDAGGTWRIEPALTHDSSGGVVPLQLQPDHDSPLSLDVCSGCGRTRWCASGRVERSRAKECVGAACRGCGALDRLRLDQFEQAGVFFASRLPVLLPRALLGIGSFAVEACRSCGLMEWFAQGLDELASKRDHGATLLEPQAAANEGPYR